MKIVIGTTHLHFPLDIILPEQIQFLYVIQKLLINKTHGVIGIPSISDFPFTALCFFQSLKVSFSVNFNVWVCLDSQFDVEKTVYKMENLNRRKRIKVKNRQQFFEGKIGTFFNKNLLCIHPNISAGASKQEIEDFCNSLYFGADLRKKKIFNFLSRKNSHNSCYYLVNFQKNFYRLNSNKTYFAENYRDWGFRKKICPYYLMRFSFSKCYIKMVTYHDLLELIKSSFSNIHPLEKQVLILSNGIKFFEYINSLGKFSINSLQLNDSFRALLILRKKILKDQIISKTGGLSMFTNVPNSAKIRNCFSLEKKILDFKAKFLSNYQKIFKNSFDNREIRLSTFFQSIRGLIKYCSILLHDSRKIKLDVNGFFSLSRSLKNLGQINSNTICFLKEKLLNLLFLRGIFQLRFFEGINSFLSFLKNLSLIHLSTYRRKNIFKSHLLYNSSEFKQGILSIESFEKEILNKIFFEKFRNIIILEPLEDNFKILGLIGDISFSFYGSLGIHLLKSKKLETQIIHGVPGGEEKLEDSNFWSFKKDSNTGVNLTNFKENYLGILCLFGNKKILDEFIYFTKNRYLFNALTTNRVKFFQVSNEAKNIQLYQSFKLALLLGIDSIYFTSVQNDLIRMIPNYPEPVGVLFINEDANSIYSSFPLKNLRNRKRLTLNPYLCDKFIDYIYYRNPVFRRLNLDSLDIYEKK